MDWELDRAPQVFDRAREAQNHEELRVKTSRRIL